MIHAQDRSFIGVGMLSSKNYQAASGLLEVGNSHSLALQHPTEQRALPNYRTGIGNNNSKTRVTAVTGSYTLHDVTPANLAHHLNAVIHSVAAGEVSGELQPVVGQPRELVVFKYLVDTSQPVTVTLTQKTVASEAAMGNAGDGQVSGLSVTTAGVGAYTVTLTSETDFTLTGPGDIQIGSGTVGTPFVGGGLAFTVAAGSTPFAEDDAFTITVSESAASAGEVGTDYIVTPYGIQLTENTSMSPGTLTVGYTRLAADVSEVLAQATQGEKTLHFAGMNDAQDGEVYDVTIHRVKINIIQELPVSSTDYAALAVTFEALQDVTRVGQGLSQFYTMRQVKRAA
ncbi:hypothetical protein ACFSB1_11120 [Halopseudomonas phragmitis]|uniref:Uncharacterized protein n=1 Tax=Halopseudomonas phragmitis TaxID=1931241 RepID=A0A1V0B9S2_9GAMM|nr:hypothetical protein [Halopseudomonas phragmitis]AQZ96630.1 hypothetical protein BVH74_18560 [Halopseudomonas phragmitis]